MSRHHPLEVEAAAADKPSQKKTSSREKKSKKRKHIDIDIDAILDDPTSSKKPKHTHTNTPSQPSALSPLPSSASSSSAGPSPFYTQHASLYIPVPPIALHYATRGICAEILSALVLRYYPPLHGVVLAYANPTVSEDPFPFPSPAPLPSAPPSSNPPDGSTDGASGSGALATSVAEYSDPFIWVSAEFLVFQPRRGDGVEGWINLQSEGHVGVICWNLFNARIARAVMVRGWKWVEPAGVRGGRGKAVAKLKRDGKGWPARIERVGGMQVGAAEQGSEYQGHYESEDGRVLEGKIGFSVGDVEASASAERERSFLIIEGTMLGTVQVSGEGLSNGALNGTASRKRKRIKAEEIVK